MSISGSMDNQNVVYSYNRILFNLKKEEKFGTCYSMDVPGDLMLSEICQSQRDKYCMIPLNKVQSVVKFIQTESTAVVGRGWGERRKENYYLMGVEFQFCKMKQLLEIDGGDGGDGCTTQCEHTSYH